MLNPHMNTRTLELVQYCVAARIAEMAFASQSNTKLESYVDVATRNLCMRLTHSVYSGATEFKVVSVPATWRDGLKIEIEEQLKKRRGKLAAIRARRRYGMWILWAPLVLITKALKWLAKHPPQYLEITFQARELFPDMPMDGPQAVVVAGVPEFSMPMYDKKPEPPDRCRVRQHTEPASVVCGRCATCIPLKDALRPKDAHEKAWLCLTAPKPE